MITTTGPATFARRFPFGRAGTATRVADTCLSAAGQIGWQGRGCCLTFHRAVSAAAWPGQPNAGFHIDITYLERLLRHLLSTGWLIVTLDEALRMIDTRDTRRFVNISVDDCYRDAAELIVPLFRKLGVPVTLFVTTRIPDGTLLLRNAGLETILQREDSVVDGDVRYNLDSTAARRTAYGKISAHWDTQAEPDATYVEFCRRNGYDYTSLDSDHRLSWDMLRALSSEVLVEIGGHTITHPRISDLSPGAAIREIGGCRERLEAELDRPVKHFAFPFGRRGDCGPRDFAIARQAGFVSAATTRKGLMGNGVDPFRLPRNTLNGTHRRLSLAYAHLTGASGMAARALGRD